MINEANLQSWIDEVSGARREVTRSYYDRVYDELSDYYGISQYNLRKRVAIVTYEDEYDADDHTYDNGTYYSYDIHGNVTFLYQHNLKHQVSDYQLSRVQYAYDLISGNVHEVGYNGGTSFTHRYRYDSDNRITEVQTNRDGVIWDREAKYLYYAHGPLARVELGDLQVQGVDYVYTLQGWIKGVNSNTLEIGRDPGGDSDPNGVNKHFAKDVYGYSLGYFAGDYAPINPGKTGTGSFYASLAGSDVEAARHNLYNGNIGSMVTTITNPSTRDILPQGTAYKYDQLNRLLESKAFTNIDVGDNEWQSGSSYIGRYHNLFSYDANGNILTQLRKDAAGATIDELTYRYAKDLSGNVLQNRLYHINDLVNPADYGDDIDDMGLFEDDLSLINSDNNYGYTEIGELKFDKQEEIAEIRWRVDGKVKAVIRDPLSTKKNLKFDYDPMGQRIAKHIYDSQDNWEKSMYYVRGSKGNVMAVYEYTADEIEETESYKLKEQHIYGSSRLGMDTREIELIGYEYPTEMHRELGHKQYELSNHLGNVLTLISDKKTPVEDTGDPGTILEYEAHILVAMDYSPFGVTLDDRNFSSEEYRYGFNGMEKDDEMKGNGNSYDFEMRIYDSRKGLFLIVDQAHFVFPYVSPYNFSHNNPVRNIDVNGFGPEDKVKKQVDLLNRATESLFKFFESQSDKVKEINIKSAEGYNDHPEWSGLIAMSQTQDGVFFKLVNVVIGQMSGEEKGVQMEHDVKDKTIIRSIGIIHSHIVSEEFVERVQNDCNCDFSGNGMPPSPSDIRAFLRPINSFYWNNSTDKDVSLPEEGSFSIIDAGDRYYAILISDKDYSFKESEEMFSELNQVKLQDAGFVEKRKRIMAKYMNEKSGVLLLETMKEKIDFRIVKEENTDSD